MAERELAYHERIATLEAWNALPRPEPWLDAPDGPGWWIYEPDTSDPFPVYLDKPTWSKEIICQWLEPWTMKARQFVLSQMPKGRWQRAIAKKPEVVK